jgi:NTE family protein
MQHKARSDSTSLAISAISQKIQPFEVPMLPLLLTALSERIAAMRLWRAWDAGGRAGGGKRINLALQGGGAHGAFTWGVIDHLLDDGRVTIDGISGTSAGAVNAVMLADGLARGGPEEARARLAEFWRAASLGGALPDLQRNVVERLFSFMPGAGMNAWLGTLSRFWSPYDLNPLNINPLKGLIERFADFDAIRRDGRALFIAATNVQTGRLRVFTRKEISAEAVMASACLPLLFRAVEIDGAHYWDGGYAGNPALLPFLRSTLTEDVLVVQINPLERTEVPSTAREIANRANEITFNASLMADMRAIALVNRMIDRGRLKRGFGPDQLRRIRLHRIALDDMPESYDAASKLNTGYEFFEMLKKRGQRAARRFLDEHFADIGRRGTVDLQAEISGGTPAVSFPRKREPITTDGAK